jgi:hypothetical protein
VKAETEEVWGLFVFIAGGAMSEFKEESSSGTIAGSNASGPAANIYVLYLSPEDDRYQNRETTERTTNRMEATIEEARLYHAGISSDRKRRRKSVTQEQEQR